METESGGKMCRHDLPKIVVIAGTNASGKSLLAIELAKKYNGEIISADSRQIYKGFDLCCGKITKREMEGVAHHLLDICDIGESYSVSEYQRDVYSIIPQILDRGHIPFLVGGTGLYISSVVYGYEFKEEIIDLVFRKELEAKSLEELQKMLSPEAVAYLNGNVSDSNNKRRLIRLIERSRNGEELKICNNPKFSVLQLGVTWKKEILGSRIDERLKQRIDQGMIEEVRQYIKAGNPPEYLMNLGLEYRYITRYVTGGYSSFEVFYKDLSQAIKKFAKRQKIWFKRDKTIQWLDMENNGFEQACGLVDSFLV